MDWYRTYAGTATDPKWVLVARIAGTIPGVVASVWGALLDHASQNDPRGSVADFDCEVLAAFYGYEPETVAAVVDAMRGRGMIDADGMLTAWAKRQPKRERDDDLSTERTRRFKERQKAQAVANAPDGTPEPTDEGAGTPRNATERLEESRGDKRTTPPVSPPNRGRTRKGRPSNHPPYTAEFEEAWKTLPPRSGNDPKPDAFRAWSARLGEGVPAAEIIDGAERYGRYCEATGKAGTEFVMQGARFFGPSRPWEQAWTLPPPTNGSRPVRMAAL